VLGDLVAVPFMAEEKVSLASETKVKRGEETNVEFMAQAQTLIVTSVRAKTQSQ
jgi:hypothetical protein